MSSKTFCVDVIDTEETFCSVTCKNMNKYCFRMSCDNLIDTRETFCSFDCKNKCFKMISVSPQKWCQKKVNSDYETYCADHRKD